MKKKQSASGIFFSMFLRAVVVILAIVIVCLIFALVRSLIHGKSEISRIRCLLRRRRKRLRRLRRWTSGSRSPC